MRIIDVLMILLRQMQIQESCYSLIVLTDHLASTQIMDVFSVQN